MYTNEELADLLAGMDEDEQANWIRDHGSRISEENLEFLRTSRDAPPLSEASKSFLSDLYERKISKPLAERESDFIVDNPDVDQNQDGEIDDPDLREQVQESPERAKMVVEFWQRWGYAWDDSILERLENAGLKFDSLEDLMGSDIYQEAIEESDPLLNSLLGDPPATTAYRFKFEGQDISIPINQVESAQKIFSFDSPTAVESAVRHAAAYGIRTAAGDIAWQPVAALWKLFDVDDQALSGTREQSTRLLREQADLRARIARNERAKAPYSVIQADRDRLNAVNQQLQEAATGNLWSQTRTRLIQGYKQGFQQYDNETFAFFHAADPELASRLAAKPGEISRQDYRMIGSMLAKAGMAGEDAESFAEAMVAIGWADPLMTNLHIQQQKALAAAAGGGAVRMQPDPVQVRQSAKDFYRQLFMEDPSEATLDSFAAQISSVISSAADDEQVNVDARVRQIAEGLPEYQEYYGNKPAGMLEEEYQNQFIGAQRSMLGDELAGNQAVRLGMQSGKYQTTIGATMGTQEAWDNSTFLERLAQAGQTFARNT